MTDEGPPRARTGSEFDSADTVRSHRAGGRRLAGLRLRGTVRLGLLALAIPKGVVATWIIVAPASYYESYPSLGRGWLYLLPPGGEHLLTELGAALLALAAMLLLAAISLERRFVQSALVAVLLQGLPHLGYHLRTFSALPPLDAFVNLVIVGTGPALALVLLRLSRSLRAFDSHQPLLERGTVER